MSQKPKALDERTIWSWERILLLPAVAAPIVLMVVTGIFWPDQGGFVPAWEEAGAVGVVLMSALGFIAGVVAIGRNNAWKIISGHRVFQGATSDYYSLSPRFAPIDVSRVQIDKTLPPAKQAEIRADLARMVPGTNGRGEPVAIGYRWGGGLVYADGEFIIRGRDFIVLEIGTGKAVQLGKNVCYVTDLVLVDHALIDPEIIRELTEKTRGEFIYNVTKVYITGEVLTWWRDFFAVSHPVRKIVNEAQGFDAVFRAFARETRDEGMDLTKLSVKQIGELKSAVYDWLSRRGDGFGVQTHGWSDGMYAPLYFSEVPRRVRAETRADRAESRAAALEAQLEGRAIRGAQIYGMRAPRRMTAEVQDSMDQIPGISGQE